jgi:hypothetical protein
MDDLLAGLTDALRSRIWAALNQLNHRLRSKQICWNECIREAYVVCARELPPELAVALVAHYGRALRWLATHRQGPPRLEYKQTFLGTFKPVKIATYEVIPEADLQARVAEIVTDLVADWKPEAQAASPARGQRTSANQAADAPPIVALLDRVVQTEGVSLAKWARGHHIARAVLFEWRGAGGRAVKGRVSPAKARDVEAAVHRDALRLRLIPAHTD